GIAHLRAFPAVKRLLAVGALAAALAAGRASAHDAPYSFLDLQVGPRGLDGTLTVHVFDAAHELGLRAPDSLLDSTRAAAVGPRLAALLGSRLALRADGRLLAPRW